MFITTTGMVCPVGLSAEGACAAKRAGISAIENLPYQDNAGRAVVGASVPGLEWTERRDLRLLHMLVDVIAELVEKRPGIDWERVPLLIGLAEPERPGGAAQAGQSIVARVQDELGLRFHREESWVFASGHTAGFQALGYARHLLGDGTVKACVVCGVDSLVNATTLSWLDRSFRLKTTANRDGVIPGEAAAAVMLEAQSTDASVEVTGIGFGTESSPILADTPLLGHGLTDAARTALAEAGLGLHEIDLRLSDVTGELYGFKELPLVEGRLMRVVRKQAQPLWHWSEAIGDTGAAAGVAQLVLAEQAFRRGYAPGRSALCLTSALSGDRSAVVVQRPRS